MPTASHSAMSSAEIAIIAMPPRPATIVERHRSNQIASTSVASRPTTRGAKASSMQAAIVRITGTCIGCR